MLTSQKIEAHLSYASLHAVAPHSGIIYSNAYIVRHPKSSNAALELDVELRRGMTIHGQVIGPDGRPVPDTWMISRVVLGPGGSWQGWEHGRRLRPASDSASLAAPMYPRPNNRKKCFSSFERG